MSKKHLFLILGFLLLVSGVIIFLTYPETGQTLLSPWVDQNESIAKPLEKYYFSSLAEKNHQASEIKLVKEITTPALTDEDYKTWLFTYQANGKTVSGMTKIPNVCQDKTCPVIIMLRGYADDKIYFTGIGTHKAAGVFAQNGFITLAPDFLGFGQSDSPEKDFLEARFTRPSTAINLIKTAEKWDKTDELFIWGHSNGGQIALSVLEITQKSYPTTLWAPVTKGFPESVFHYMDDYQKLDDLGKEVYNRINSFCQNYQCKQVSIDQFFNRIKAPIQLHQGGQDPLVPQSWSDSFVKKIKSLDKPITYYTYPACDHNLKQNWDKVVERDLEFFSQYLND